MRTNKRICGDQMHITAYLKKHVEVKQAKLDQKAIYLLTTYRVSFLEHCLWPELITRTVHVGNSTCSTSNEGFKY